MGEMLKTTTDERLGEAVRAYGTVMYAFGARVGRDFHVNKTRPSGVSTYVEERKAIALVREMLMQAIAEEISRGGAR